MTAMTLFSKLLTCHPLNQQPPLRGSCRMPPRSNTPRCPQPECIGRGTLREPGHQWRFDRPSKRKGQRLATACKTLQQKTRIAALHEKFLFLPGGVQAPQPYRSASKLSLSRRRRRRKVEDHNRRTQVTRSSGIGDQCVRFGQVTTCVSPRPTHVHWPRRTECCRPKV